MSLTLRGSSGFTARIVSSAVRKMSTFPEYKTLSISSPAKFVVHVQLNRPEKHNAFNRQMWIDIGECFKSLDKNPDYRVVVLSGAGEKSFSSGLDLNAAAEFGAGISEHSDIARKGYFILQRLREFQEGMSSLEVCRKPVIAAIHGNCIGAGVDIITAADIRFCSQNAIFQVKEIDIGMAADVGTLQRLPKVIGSRSLVNELCLTGRKLLADEAKQCGLVSQVHPDKSALLEKSVEIAKVIASKSPVAVQTTKQSLIYSRDHSVQEGLDHIGLHNMAMLQSEDFMQAVMAQATKDEEPVFSRL